MQPLISIDIEDLLCKNSMHTVSRDVLPPAETYFIKILTFIYSGHTYHTVREPAGFLHVQYEYLLHDS